MPPGPTTTLGPDRDDELVAAGPIEDTASASDANAVPQSLIDHLMQREAWRTNVYLDSKNLPTAGMGHLLSAAENQQYKLGGTVPDDVLKAWQQADSIKAYHAALAQAAELDVQDENFINALASVNFQLGTGWNHDFKNTWAIMKAHEWERAAVAVAQSKWNTQTPTRVADFQKALRALI